MDETQYVDLTKPPETLWQAMVRDLVLTDHASFLVVNDPALQKQINAEAMHRVERELYRKTHQTFEEYAENL